MHSTVQSETLKGRERSGDLDLGKRIILKLDESAQLHCSSKTVRFICVKVKV
jgi:hypothetical protein